jgi:hypothetical protein
MTRKRVGWRHVKMRALLVVARRLIFTSERMIQVTLGASASLVVTSVIMLLGSKLKKSERRSKSDCNFTARNALLMVRSTQNTSCYDEMVTPGSRLDAPPASEKPGANVTTSRKGGCCICAHIV